MNILHRINWDTVGGTEILFSEFLEWASHGQSSLRHNLLISDYPHRFFSLAASKINGVLVARKRTPRGFRIPGWPPLLRRMHVHRAVERVQPDVLVSWDCFANSELVSLARRQHCPIVLQAGGSVWSDDVDATQAKLFLREVGGALCSTRATARMLKLRWDYRERVTVNPYGLRSAVTATPAPRRVLPEQRVIRLGMVSRLLAKKGGNLVIHALRQLVSDGVDVELHIAGTGPLELEWRKLSQRLGIESRVRWRGLKEDIVAFYDEVDVLISPSLSESFGLVNIEAAARGCPVIVADVDGLSETVSHGESGLKLPAECPLSTFAEVDGDPASIPRFGYDPQRDEIREPHFVDPTLIVAAVKEITADRDYYENMCRSASVWARNQFKFDDYAKRLLESIHIYSGYL